MSEVFEFGPFRLDPGNARLERGGAAVPLPPKTFDVLTALVRQAGSLVEKDALMRQVWPDTFVEEANISRHIWTLRKALGDDGSDERYIETIPKRGYRFAAAVRVVDALPDLLVARRTETRVISREETVVDDGPAPATVPLLEARAGPGSGGRWKAIAAASTFLLSTAAAVTWLTIARGRTAAQPPSFTRLTFGRGEIETARFVPGGRDVAYSASWQGGGPAVFSVNADRPEARPADLKGAALFSVSARGELAVRLDKHLSSVWIGTVARVPTGGGPRPIAQDVEWAEWAPDGATLTITRWDGLHGTLESPPGTVVADTRGPFSRPRYSPKGDQIALMGSTEATTPVLSVMPASGAARTRRTLLTVPRGNGLAWHPTTGEIWFAQLDDEGQTSLSAVTTDGRQRVVWRGPGSFALQDIAADGRVLMIQDRRETNVSGRGPGAAEEIDLGWRNNSRVYDISNDGRSVVLSESGGRGGANDITYIRRTDGSPPVRLGEGRAVSLSPDGRFVLTQKSPYRFLLLPVGPGAVREIRHDDVFSLMAWFFPDSRHLLVNGQRRTGVWQYFESDIEGGAFRPVTREGIDNSGGEKPLSPDGTLAVGVVYQPVRKLVICPVDGGDPIPAAGVLPNEVPIRFSGDSRGLYVYDRETLPARVHLVDFRTGARTLWKEFSPADPAGVTNIFSFVITPDGRAYAYNVVRTLSELYVVDGLR